MSKTLVVSDNDILNQLYVINLEVYLATEVTLVLTTHKAQELILSGKKYDLIISMNMINGHDSAVSLNEFLIGQNLKIPFMVIGNPIKEIPNAIVVQSSYHLQNLLRLCADALGVTSKSMAALSMPDYYSVDTKYLMNLGEAPCQMFLQVKKSGEEINYVMVAKVGSSIKEILKKFHAEGILILHVNKLDRLILVNQISKILCNFIQSTEHLGVAEKSEAIEAGFEFVAADFCQSPQATQEVMAIAIACAKSMEEMSKEVQGLKALLQFLMSDKKGYIYSHSILTSFIANHIIKNVPWGGESHLEKINFVLFFHDIVLAPIYLKHPTLKYEEDLLFSDELTDSEKESVLNHARIAAELIMTYRRSPMGADLLIKQHHGMTSGVGFAIEFKDDISPLSKVVLIAESFIDEYLKAKDFDPKYQIELNKILPILNEKFKKTTYRKIIETLKTIRL